MGRRHGQTSRPWLVAGSGAQVTATIGPYGAVTVFDIQNGGSGYVLPPVITFANGNGVTKPTAEAVISGGQPNGGTAASFKAYVSGGAVTYVRVLDPGSGYADRLAVKISPGARTSFPVSPMAPAGFLVSSLRQMATFTRAAFADEKEKLGPRKSLIRDGFRISEHPYACTQGNPRLKTCPATTTRSGFAWMVKPGDTSTGRPKVISKDGGIPGYSTFVTFMPEHRIGVVVSVNTRPQGEEYAVAIGANILNAIYYECLRYGFGHAGCE